MIVAAVLLFLVIALLAIPVDFSLHVAHEERWEGTAAAAWMFGLVAGRIAPRTRVRKKKAPRPAKKKAKPRRRYGRKAMAMLRSPRFVRRARTLVKRLLGAIYVRKLDVDAQIGLPDPADTGQLWSVLGPLPFVTPLPRQARVRLAPDFDEERLRLNLDAEIRVLPLEVVVEAITFLFAPATVRAVVAGVRA